MEEIKLFSKYHTFSNFDFLFFGLISEIKTLFKFRLCFPAGPKSPKLSLDFLHLLDCFVMFSVDVFSKTMIKIEAKITRKSVRQ